ncbi:hypothetical protein L228DRAFT_167725 [Xylona heveae TC161]|uniref:Uncharacterized protein n=1 Tax=Xylona heveae (strain CBS 132557 / TC161) TaxID=1328760 RepID=A0A165FN79_XYLHT|nr:hypothetical protein L228DRAFT_167725 [Xylona heveae TC161]KZF21182.1 hypothetical protein L228DRAFT_167725 [Xylona heveae TC161]
MNVTMEKPKKGENPTNKIWSLSTFFATSLPLAFGSIIVPLVLGAVIRYFVQFTAKYRAYWRITYIVILVLYVFVFYIILPALFWVIPKLRYSMFYTDNYLIISIVTDVVIILFAMGQVYWAFRRKSRRVVWVFCLVVFAVTSVFDCLPFAYYSYNYHYSYGNPPVRVMGLVQLALLFLVWSAPRWRRWARNIRRRLSRGTP